MRDGQECEADSERRPGDRTVRKANGESSDGQPGHDTPAVGREWISAIRRENPRCRVEVYCSQRQECDGGEDCTCEVGPPVKGVEGSGGCPGSSPGSGSATPERVPEAKKP